MRDDKYNLEERTARFGELIISFTKRLPYDRVTDELVKQIVRSATSIGANYMEADGASSKRDFKHKIGLCKKEAKETKHWLRMIAKAHKAKADACRELWQEAHELTLIFSAISLSCAKES